MIQRIERTRGRKLQEQRQRLFTKEPLCRLCQERGVVSEATQRDHILPLHKGGTDTEDNIQPLCDSCHDIKTVKERGQRVKPQRCKGLDW